MWKSRLKLAGSAVAAAIAVGCLSAPALASDTTAQAAGTVPVATEPAVWAQKEVQFDYMGFTTHFTCDGLRDAVRDMVLQLGARKDDLKILEGPCSRPDRVDPFPGVKIKMSVLVPVGAAPPPSGTDSPIVEAHWKTIKLPYRTTNIDAAGQCELLEQFKRTVLPLFTARNVDLHAACVPHQLEPLGTSLQAEVLVTDQKKAPGKQASAADAR